MRVVIFAGKKEKDNDYIRNHLTINDYVIACDGGLETIHSLDLKPEIIIGDFDSVDYNILELFSETKKIEYDCEKDFTDLELTLQYCIELKPSEIIVFGATGGRMDHNLSNVGLLARYTEKGLDIKFIDKCNEMFIANKNIAIKKTKQYLTVLPVKYEAVISLKGTKYELDNRKINEFETLTVSNEITGNFAFLDVLEGRVLVIQSDPTNLS